MKMEFNLNFFPIDYNIFSVTYEQIKKTVCIVTLNPHWGFFIATITTIFANKETFPLHNLLQRVKGYVGGDWLKFALEFIIAFTNVALLIAVLSMVIFIGRLIRNRHDCYNLSLPMYVLVQMTNEESEDVSFWFLSELFKRYLWISTHYINYLIVATPNFSDLYLLIDKSPSLIFPLLAASAFLAYIFAEIARTVGHFLGISNL